MLCYDKIRVSESIDVNQTSASRECMTCHYWYFLDNGLTFQPTVNNGSHDVLI